MIEPGRNDGWLVEGFSTLSVTVDRVVRIQDAYRMRHATYRTDVDLQYASAQLPFVATWDDHEVVNNWAGSPSHPVALTRPRTWPRVPPVHPRRRHLHTDFRVVPYVTTPGAPVDTRRSFVVEAGVPGLQDA